MASEDDDIAYPDDGPDDGTSAEPPKKRRGGPPPASEKQLGFLKVLLDKIKLSEDELKKLLEEVAGETSIDDLDVAQASQVIDQLQIEAKERNVNLNAGSKASEKQVGFIRSLKRRAHLTDAEFEDLLEEIAGTRELEEIGKREASALIDELQAISKGEKSGPTKKAAPKRSSGPPPADDDDVPF